LANLKRRENLGDVGIKGMLQGILEKQDVRLTTGFISLTVGSCEYGDEPRSWFRGV
jgi:hypothetical protein